LKVSHYIKTSKADIVHTQLNYANIVGTFAAHLSGIPSVASLHNASIHLFNDRRYRTWLETWMLKSYSCRIIACGYTVAKVQQPRFKAKPLMVISNPVPLLKDVSSKDTSDFRKTQFSDGKGILLVTVGRLIPEKGYPDMIQAISHVQKQTEKGFKLVIVGSGPLLGQLRESVNAHGLEEVISFVGQRNDVPAILAAGDIYISTSHFEGQSIAVMEAMAAGLPVIATEVGDNHIVIPRDCGILVPVGQPEEFAKQILKLMNNSNERAQFAKIASPKVKKDYSSSTWIDKLLAVYQEVLDE
jgi:glycosyltransferase involved in cell wall biosynthesis